MVYGWPQSCHSYRLCLAKTDSYPLHFYFCLAAPIKFNIEILESCVKTSIIFNNKANFIGLDYNRNIIQIIWLYWTYIVSIKNLYDIKQAASYSIAQQITLNNSIWKYFWYEIPSYFIILVCIFTPNTYANDLSW